MFQWGWPGSVTAPQAPEPGTGLRANLETGTGTPAVFRNDHIWIVQRVFGGPSADNARTTVRWAKIHTSGVFVDGGSIEDASLVNPKWYIYPSISVNRRDDVLIGFTQTSATEFPSAAYAFRRGTDPAGSMRDVVVAKSGEGFYYNWYSNRNRWGDYSQTQVNPSDDTTLWTIQEYSLPQAGTGNHSGRWSTWWTAITAEGPVAPGPPSGLGGAALGTSVSLSWTAPTTGGLPTAYRIEAGGAPGFSNLANFSTGTPATTFAGSGVPIGLYYLRVRATNNFGTSDPSNEIVLRVGPEPPGVPTGLGVSAVGSTIALTWSAPGTGGAPSAYVIEAGSQPGLANLANFSTNSTLTSWSTGGVPYGTYYFRVRATNVAGTSGPSNEVQTVLSPPPVPGAPGTLSGTGGPSSLSFTWSAPTTGGAPTTYVIEAGSATGLSNVANFPTGNLQTTFAASGIAVGTYYIRVRAQNGTGTGPASNEVAIGVGCTSAPASPTGLQITANSGGHVAFSWVAPAGTPQNAPASYVLQAGTGPGLANLVNLDLGSAATTFTANGVGTGTYYVRVRAKNACGTGAVSNEVVLVVP